MITVGIDVASTKHDYYIELNTGEHFTKPTTIQNNIQGFKKLHNSIQEFVKLTNCKDICIGLESTGHYHTNILNYLVKLDYKVYLINPLLTNMTTKSLSVRKTKTDKIDCVSICRYLQGDQVKLNPYTLLDYHISELKSLSRERFILRKDVSKVKIKVNRLLVEIFPEYLKFFSNLYIKTSIALLKEYSSPEAIANVRIDKLGRFLNKHSRGHHGKKTALKLRDLANNTIGTPSKSKSLALKHCLQTIEHYEEQILEYEMTIKTIIDKHYSNILTIPGLSYVTGGLILGEIGQISKFSTPDKLLAFAGLDPSVYQSGNYSSKKNVISKRGSKYLRWALHTVSSLIVHKDATFNAYYNKKLSEGKHHFTALGHVSKKLTRVLHSLLKNQSSYVTIN